ncbi:MAG TPA: formate dehydrogenase [Ramlibacter sp.]
MKRPNVDTERRRILSTAGSVGAAGVAAGLLGPAATAQVPAAVATKPAKPSGYHDTDHTRTYYRLARY